MVDMHDIDMAVDTLRRGGIILYPTDTVWGIGCDATNTEAVRRIYALKNRDDHKALITLVPNIAALERTVDGIPEVAYELIECAVRPLTIIYDRAIGVSPALTGDDGTLAVRVTGHEFSALLCRRLRRPLVSTSANISGLPTPRVFADIDRAILDGVDYVCSSEHDTCGVDARPSMVIRLRENGEFKIIRS